MRSSWNWSRRARSPSDSGRRRRDLRILHPAGYGTSVAEGKDSGDSTIASYVREDGIARRPVAHEGVAGRHRRGNLHFRKTARNFNPMIAPRPRRHRGRGRSTSSRSGELAPDEIDTPGIYVDRIVAGARYEGRIEFRTVTSGAVGG